MGRNVQQKIKGRPSFQNFNDRKNRAPAIFFVKGRWIMFPDTICYKNPCSNPGFKAKKNLTIKIWEIRLIRNSYSLSTYPTISIHKLVLVFNKKVDLAAHCHLRTWDLHELYFSQILDFDLLGKCPCEILHQKGFIRQRKPQNAFS